MRLIFPVAFLAGVMAATPVFAGGQMESELQKRLVEDKRVAAYLGVSKGAELTFDESQVVSESDLNGDGKADPVLAVRKGKSVVLAAFVTADAGVPGYAGSVRIDSDQIPSLLVCDLTGDGVDDLRLEFARKDGAGRTSRTVVFAGLTDGKLVERFRGVTDESERSGIYQRKSEHLMRLEDADGDKVYELEVTSRLAELIGSGSEEREIAGSVTTGTSIYRLKDGRFELDRVERLLPTDEMRLEAAMELLDAGAVERAAQIAVDLSSKASIMGTKVSERATEMLKRAKATGGPETVAAGPADETSPDAPAVEAASS